MVIARGSFCAGNILKLWSTFQNHPFREGTHFFAEDFLPGRLAVGREGLFGQRGAAGFQFCFVDQDIGGAFLQVDPHHVAGLDNGQATAVCCLW